MKDNQQVNATSNKAVEVTESHGKRFILASATSRFCQHKVPSWLSYWVTFFAFPLNMMVLSMGMTFYILVGSFNVYLKTVLWAYLAWILLLDRNRCHGVGYDTQASFPFQQLRHWVRSNWMYGISTAYYPITLHKTAKLPAYHDDTTKRPCQYVFACHPHGVIGVGTMSVFGTAEVGFATLFPGIDTYLVALGAIFNIPFFRDWCLLAGIFSADKTSFEHIFTTKHASAAINLGGAAEATMPFECNPQTGHPVMKFLLQDRKGFCKIALQYGVSLVPVLALEERLLFDLIRLPPALYTSCKSFCKSTS